MSELAKSLRKWKISRKFAVAHLYIEMKQILRFSVILLTVMLYALPLTSCDDDDYFGDPLVGTWQMVAPADSFYNEFTFNPDGSGTYYVEDWFGADTYYIEWYTTGRDRLVVEFPNEWDSMYFIYNVSGRSLYLYPEEGGDPWVYRFY